MQLFPDRTVVLFIHRFKMVASFMFDREILSKYFSKQERNHKEKKSKREIEKEKGKKMIQRRKKLACEVWFGFIAYQP